MWIMVTPASDPLSMRYSPELVGPEPAESRSNATDPTVGAAGRSTTADGSRHIAEGHMNTTSMTLSRRFALIAGIIFTVSTGAVVTVAAQDDTGWATASASPDDTHWGQPASPDDTHW
jgi:hypothetical protein